VEGAAGNGIINTPSINLTRFYAKLLIGYQVKHNH